MAKVPRENRKALTDKTAKYKAQSTKIVLMVWQTYFIEFSYLLASILFIFGLKGLSHPETAKRGMHLAEIGMMLAIVGTLMHFEIVSYTWIIVGLLLGGLLGAAMGVWVPMTAPPRTRRTRATKQFVAASQSSAPTRPWPHRVVRRAGGRR